MRFSNVDIDSYHFSSGYEPVILHDDGSSGLGKFLDKSTDDSGQIVLDFVGSGFKYANKPNINVIVEGAYQWHVASWSTDANGNYTGLQYK